MIKIAEDLVFMNAEFENTRLICPDQTMLAVAVAACRAIVSRRRMTPTRKRLIFREQASAAFSGRAMACLGDAGYSSNVRIVSQTKSILMRRALQKQKSQSGFLLL